jgi:serine/threonine protein kinase
MHPVTGLTPNLTNTQLAEVLVRGRLAVRPQILRYEHSVLSGVTGNPDSHFRTVYRVVVDFMEKSQKRTVSLILKHYCGEHSQKMDAPIPFASFQREAQLQALLGHGMPGFVAQVYHHGLDECCIWTEDAGDQSLYAIWNVSETHRRSQLIQALTKELALFHIYGPDRLAETFTILRPSEEDYLREMLQGVDALHQLTDSAISEQSLATVCPCLRRVATDLASNSDSLAHGDLDPDVNTRIVNGDLPKLIDFGNTGRWWQAGKPEMLDTVWLQPAETDFGGLAHYFGQEQTDLFVESYLQHRRSLTDNTPSREDFVRTQTTSLPFVHALKRAAQHAQERKRTDELFAEKPAPMYGGYMGELLGSLQKTVRDAPWLKPIHSIIGNLKVKTEDYT